MKVQCSFLCRYVTYLLLKILLHPWKGNLNQPISLSTEDSDDNILFICRLFRETFVDDLDILGH